MEKLTTYLILYFSLLVFMLVLDFIWLKYIVGDFFTNQLRAFANIQDGGIKVNLLAGLFVYLVMTLGALIFLLPLSNSYKEAALYGALFGFVLYAVFDGTNLSFIKDYPIKFMIVDIAWGTGLLSLSSVFLHYLKSIV